MATPTDNELLAASLVAAATPQQQRALLDTLLGGPARHRGDRDRRLRGARSGLRLIGVLLGYAAITADPQQANGLDGALHTVLGQPLGRYLLTVVAIGLAAAGVFAFAQARYRRL